MQQILSINDYMIPQQNKSFYSEKSTTNDNVQRTDVENGSAFGERKFEKNGKKTIKILVSVWLLDKGKIPVFRVK